MLEFFGWVLGAATMIFILITIVKMNAIKGSDSHVYSVPKFMKDIPNQNIKKRKSNDYDIDDGDDRGDDRGDW